MGSRGNDCSVAIVATAWLSPLRVLVPLSTMEPPQRRRTETVRSEELRALRLELAVLEQTVARLRGAHAVGPLDGSSHAALWAQVAQSQRAQRGLVLSTNAVLQATARTHQRLARRLCRKAQQLLTTVRPRTTPAIAPVRPLEGSLIYMPLRNRLEAIVAHTCSNTDWMGTRPPIGLERQDCTVQLFGPDEGMRLRFRYAGYLPFKLGLVVAELSSSMLTAQTGSQSSSTMTTQSLSELFGPALLHIRDSPSSEITVEGSAATRRVLVPDGSIVFVTAVRASGLTGEGESNSFNVMDGYEMHEASWLRVGRVPSMPSVVYIESVCTLEIRPGQDVAGSFSRLERIKNALLRARDDVSESNRQRLENRLLDASRQEESSRQLRMN